MNTPINDGGPAFPLGQRPFTPNCSGREEAERVRYLNKQMQGMSLRDYYAGLAMQSILLIITNPAVAAGLEKTGAPKDGSFEAKTAYQVADAMIAQREK